MLIESDSKLVMIGDSITDTGRARPVGDGPFDAWGNGYVNLVGAMLGACRPERRIRVINVGVGGDTVRHLEARWQTDVLDLEPDWLSIMIGINDVWRRFDAPLCPERRVPLDEYRTTLERLVAGVRPALKGLVLITPYFIEPNQADLMRAEMDLYGQAVAEIAGRHDALLVDVQAAFDDLLRHTHPMALARDRVHPNTTGHAVIARAFLKAVEMEF